MKRCWMLTHISFVLCFVLAPSLGPAQEKAELETHVVKPGDTLWDLAGYYLHDPFLWPSIWEQNKTEIRDPHWIYPGQKFLIAKVASSGTLATRQTPMTEEEEPVGACRLLRPAPCRLPESLSQPHPATSVHCQRSFDQYARAPGREITQGLWGSREP